MCALAKGRTKTEQLDCRERCLWVVMQVCCHSFVDGFSLLAGITRKVMMLDSEQSLGEIPAVHWNTALDTSQTDGVIELASSAGRSCFTQHEEHLNNLAFSRTSRSCDLFLNLWQVQKGSLWPLHPSLALFMRPPFCHVSSPLGFNSSLPLW